MFSTSYQEAVRGYFAASKNGKIDVYIRTLLSEINKDLKSRHVNTQMDTIPKLLFLHLAGVDTNWANFSLVDVMAIENYSAKRIAYLAASVMWNQYSDATIMATNIIMKDLNPTKPMITSAALSSIPMYMSQSLASNISHEVVTLMSSTVPVLKQKAMTAFISICTNFPGALAPGLIEIKNRLSDDKPSVVLAALTVIGELASYEPKPFVVLIPKLYKMLDDFPSSMISIRVLQILRQLTEVEPRLARKMSAPLLKIIDTTSYFPLLFEALRCIAEIPTGKADVLEKASHRASQFLEDRDPNLRYLALVLFAQMLKQQPTLVSRYRAIITELLNSEEESVRMAALELYGALTTEDNLDTVVGNMFDCMRMATRRVYRNHISRYIIDTCSADDYKLIMDFEWYVSILFDLLDEVGDEEELSYIAAQFNDLATRVPSTRISLLSNIPKILDSSRLIRSESLVLSCLYIIGEYSNDAHILQKLLQPVFGNAKTRIQLSCLTTVMMVSLRLTEGEFKEFYEVLKFKLPHFENSRDVEIQSFAMTLSRLASIVNENYATGQALLAHMSTDVEEELEIPDDLSKPNPILEITDEELEDWNKNITKKPIGKTKYTKLRKQKKVKHNKVKGPEKDFRVVHLAMNDLFDVTARKFVSSHKKPGLVAIDLLLTKLNTKVIPQIDFQLQTGDQVKALSLPSIMHDIEQGKTVSHQIVVEITDLESPHAATLLVIPRSSDSDVMECRILFYPSLFLEPEEEDLESKREICIHSSGISCAWKKEPAQAIQAILNITNGTIIKQPPKIILFSKSASGSHVICEISLEKRRLQVTVLSSSETLGTHISKEIEKTLKQLTQQNKRQ